MSAPNRTTFEVTVSNQLNRDSIFVTIQAELQYAKELATSFADNLCKASTDKSQNFSAKATDSSLASSKSGSQYEQKEDAHSSYNENKSYNKSSSNSSSSNTSSNSSSTGMSVGYGPFSASGNHNSSNASSASNYLSNSNESSNHNIDSSSSMNKNIESSSYSGSNSREHSNATTLATLDENTTSFSHGKLGSTSSKLDNKKIDPGFVRISAGQSLAIPVVVESEAQVVYITVFAVNVQGEKYVIANSLQINSQHIEVKINPQNNDIILVPVKQVGGFRDLLLSWHIPQSICDSFKNCGWDDPELWNEITENDLISMGFKRG
eukprot:499207_1